MKDRESAGAITEERIGRYMVYLQEQERSPATISKYARDLGALFRYMGGRLFTKTAVLGWKEELAGRYSAASVNSMLAAANGFLEFCGRGDLRVKPLKVQKRLFCSEERELTGPEYRRLVQAAERLENRRLSLVIQTICATGIRVSELRFITGEAVRAGRAAVDNKGKLRTVFLPDKLRRALKQYAGEQGRGDGPVFVTKGGKPLDRSNIWRDMKALCADACVDSRKVFPHNLRHLFARTYYALEKDLSRLADILGHANVNTTRIYTVESGSVHARQIERMGLVLT